MTRTVIVLTLTAAFVFCTAPAAAHEGDNATQTDWSGGPGVTGPVTDWGDTFDTETNVNWSGHPGELILGRTVLEPSVEHIVDSNFDGACSVFAADVDDDDDMDVLGAAARADDITWWSNDDGSGTSWTEHTVDGDFDDASSIYATDIDDDGDTDVLGGGGNVMWWENNDGSGTSWTEHTIDRGFAANSVYAEDMDEDGDLDVLGTSYYNGITLWENVDGTGTYWVELLVLDDVQNATFASPTDLDGDDDLDIVAAAFHITGGKVLWWENDGSGGGWAEHTVDGSFDGATSVYGADADGDGDMDVLGAADNADDITWWSNDDGSGTSWTEHTVDGSFDGARSVYAADVDGDGYMDVLGAAGYADDITWWSNDDGSGTSWTEHNVDGNFDGAYSVYSEDVDGDGDMDVLGAAFLAADITWWEVTEFSLSGELVSSIYDTEGSPEWGWIDWTDDTPEGTTVNFQVRSSNDPGNMGDWSSEITSPGSLGGILTDGDRYVQYKTILEIIDTDVSPTLYDITIGWGYTGIAITSFSADSAADGVEVSWECADAVAGFNLHRSEGSGEGNAITSRNKLNAGLITGESPYAYLDAGVDEGTTYNYWLEAVDVDGASETFGPVECTWNGALPTAYALYQSRPNPASGTAVIAFDLPEDAMVTLTVYDISGRKVTTVVDETLTIGEHEAEVSGLAPGVYVYKLAAGDFSAARKMVVVD